MAMKRWLPGLAALPICALPVIWAGRREPVLPASVILMPLNTRHCRNSVCHRTATASSCQPSSSSPGEGVVFERAIAPVPLTLPSHTSLFTGRITRRTVPA